MENEKEGNCSWCFSRHKQFLLKTKGIRRALKICRPIYQCNNCRRETVVCFKRGCEDFARRVPGRCEIHCYLHRGLISSWEDDKCNLDSYNASKYCSYCYEKAEQCTVTISELKIKTFICQNCYERTNKCKECDEGVSNILSSKCSKCQGLIEDWSQKEKNKAITCAVKTCSWCLNTSRHAIRLVDKNIFQCLSCYIETTPCPECDDCMAITTMFGSSCAKCKLLKEGQSNEEWQQMLEKLRNHCKKYQSLDFLKEEARRSSKYRDEALKEGCICPNLILVLMHPRRRVYVGMILGISVSKVECFPDGHAEAWLIINKKGKGIRERSQTPTETINPSMTVDWYVILHRIMKLFIPQSDWPELPDDTVLTSTRPGNTDFIALQSLLSRFVVDRHISDFSPSAKQNYNMIMEHNDEIPLFRKILKRSPYYHPDMDIFTNLQLCEAFYRFGLYRADTVMTMEQVKESKYLTAYAGMNPRTRKTIENNQDLQLKAYSVLHGLAGLGQQQVKMAIAGVVFPPFALFLLAQKIGSVAYGQTIPILVIPIREIMLQNALLLAR